MTFQSVLKSPRAREAIGAMITHIELMAYEDNPGINIDLHTGKRCTIIDNGGSEPDDGAFRTAVWQTPVQVSEFNMAVLEDIIMGPVIDDDDNNQHVEVIIKTDMGDLTAVFKNRHNGDYEGFSIEAD